MPTLLLLACVALAVIFASPVLSARAPHPDHASQQPPMPVPGANLHRHKPAFYTQSEDTEVIPNRYLVQVTDLVTEAQIDRLIEELEGVPEFEGVKFELGAKLVSSVFRGVAAQLNKAHINTLLSDDRIEFIEPDFVTNILGTQSSPPYGLDRIDQRGTRGDGSYTYNNTAEDVTVYVIDSGVFIEHEDFEGRAKYGYSAINDGMNAGDGNGHGTHVAGTVAGKVHGVAKKAKIVSVRVLDAEGKGSGSGLLQGLQWVVENRVRTPAVACMSLGGGASESVDRAVQAMIDAGVTTAVAAGNENKDACLKSPARVGQAITVGATDIDDNRASFSNYGTCVNIFAPGRRIVSTYIGDRSATKTLSGTSMATPHVAGAIAVYLQIYPDALPDQVASDFLCFSTKDVVADPSDSPNRLLIQTVFQNQKSEEEEADNGNTSGNDEVCDPDNGCQQFVGDFAGSGQDDFEIQPGGNFYVAQFPGIHRGWLSPLAGDSNAAKANFDLKLYMFDTEESKYKQVAQSSTTGPNEMIKFRAPSAGAFTWEVVRRSGKGKYMFQLKEPTEALLPPGEDPTACQLSRTNPNGGNGDGSSAGDSVGAAAIVAPSMITLILASAAVVLTVMGHTL